MSTNNNECWKQLYACMSAVRHLPNSAYYTVSIIAFRGTNRVTLRVPRFTKDLEESRHHGRHEAWRRVTLAREAI